MTQLGRLSIKQRTGKERFVLRGGPLNFTLLDFWQWSVSDVMSNATRGILAEYLVARALDIRTDSVRDEWAPYDLETPDGIRIEVKSAAHLQSWSQRNLSSISFGVKAARYWNPDTNKFAANPSRPAHVYVFALLAHREKTTVDPLNLEQWEFYILPTRTINARLRSKHSITLRTLKELHAGPFSYTELKGAVLTAAPKIGEAPAST